MYINSTIHVYNIVIISRIMYLVAIGRLPLRSFSVADTMCRYTLLLLYNVGILRSQDHHRSLYFGTCSMWYIFYITIILRLYYYTIWYRGERCWAQKEPFCNCVNWMDSVVVFQACLESSISISSSFHVCSNKSLRRHGYER